ncbi:MAG: IclR family transcriptional regulator [Lentisphaerae bacterium]|nr:IclR family transcriptional regulator [Lentisphaerota bacterium]
MRLLYFLLRLYLFYDGQHICVQINIAGYDFMKNGEKSFSKLFEIIELVAQSPSGMSGKAISEASNIPLSTTFRMLKFMTDNDYLLSDKGVYTLGLGFVRLGNVAGTQNLLIKAARPLLAELSLQTSETVHLAKLHGDRIVYIDKVEGSRLIRMGSLIGKTSPLHCTGVGKAIFAFLDDLQREKLLAELEYTPFTPNTITGDLRMRQELDSIRQQGYSVDNCEHEDWVYCVAVPIFNREHQVIAGISISGAEMYMRDRKLQLARLLNAAANHITSAL